ncbi:hypothetical protein Tco_1253092 [Tanacetum coccineum]
MTSININTGMQLELPANDTSVLLIPEPTQPIPSFTQTAFSQPVFSQPIPTFTQPAVHFQQTQPTQTNQTSQQYPNNVQSQQFQQFQTASISANNAKFPYLEKDKYEIWAMKMEYWIQNADHNHCRKCSAREQSKEIICPIFIIYDDARDIWMAVKARFGGNEESKKMRKTMLKQQFNRILCDRRECQHKVITDFRKILEPVGINYGVKVAAAPTHSAFIGAASSGSKLNYSNQQSGADVSEQLLKFGYDGEYLLRKKIVPLVLTIHSDSETYGILIQASRQRPKDFPPTVDIQLARILSLVNLKQHLIPAGSIIRQHHPPPIRLERPATVSAGLANPAARTIFQTIYPGILQRDDVILLIKTSAGYSITYYNNRHRISLTVVAQEVDSKQGKLDEICVIKGGISQIWRGRGNHESAFLEDNPKVRGNFGHEWKYKRVRAARYGYLFSQATAEILSQAEAEIRNRGVSADRDPAGIGSAGGVSAGSTSAGSDPAGSHPAGSFDPAALDDPSCWLLSDVKSSLSLGEIEEEEYVTQPKGFEILTSQSKYTEWFKALIGLHQAHRAGNARLSAFFCYISITERAWCENLIQDKYVKDMLTKFDMESVRTATTPYEAVKTKLKDETDPPVNLLPLTSHLNAVKKIQYLKGQPKLALCNPKDSPFQLEAYSDSDYAGSHGDRKSTTEARYHNLGICTLYLKTSYQFPQIRPPILVLPVLPQGQANHPDVITQLQAWVKAQKEIVRLMLMTMDPEIQKTLEHLGAYDMLKELKMLYVQQADQELLQTVQEFHRAKQEEWHLLALMP